MMDETPVREEAGGDANTQPRNGKNNPAGKRAQNRGPALNAPLTLSREQALRELETFHALVRMLTECNNDVDRIAACLAQITAQTIGDASAVLLLEGRRDLYRVAAAHDEDANARALFEHLLAEAADMPREGGWGASVVRSGETLFMPRVPQDQMDKFPLPAFREYYERVGLASLMIVPLKGRGSVVGAVALGRHRHGRPYTENDRHFLEQIALQVGGAVESASLVSTLRREVAARLLATRALAASEQRFLSIFHASPLGIKVMDLEGMMLEANDAFQALTGYTENELIALRFLDIVHPHDAHKVLDLFKSLIRGDQLQAALEHRLLHRDGTTVWVKTTFAIVKKTPASDEADLIFGITEDLGERKRADAELLELKQHLQGSIELERLRIAQNLHDRPLQELYAVIYRLEELRLGADRDNSAVLASIINDIRKTLDSLRSTATELRPPTLSRFGLEKAARSYMQEFREKNPGIQVMLTLARDREALPEPVRVVLFRVLQEAVANAKRHSQATEIQVRFSFDAEEARLEVCDNGHGFAVPSNWIKMVREGHYGLAGMLERVTAAGGTLSVESSPGQPTTIRVTIPVQ